MLCFVPLKIVFLSFVSKDLYSKKNFAIIHSKFIFFGVTELKRIICVEAFSWPVKFKS